jgi:hypothetical protein
VTNCSTVGFSKKKRRNYFTPQSYLSFRRSPSALKHAYSGHDVSDTNLLLRETRGFLTRPAPPHFATLSHHDISSLFRDPCTSLHEMTWSHQHTEQRFESMKSSEILSAPLSTPLTPAFSCYTDPRIILLHTTNTTIMQNHTADI